MSRFVVLLFLLLVCPIFADTHIAASTDRDDVETAITASSDGDTVSIPSGSSTWASKIEFTKDIIIEGAGVGSTVITRGYNNDPLLDWDVNGGGFDLSGITFDGNGTTGTGHTHAMVYVIARAAATNNRIHNCAFEDYATRSITVECQGYQFWGLIDNNTFTASASVQHINIYGEGSGNAVTTWQNHNSKLGTADFWFIEDNTFTQTSANGDGFLDAFSGAKVVFRYNTCDGGVMVSYHGTDSGNRVSPLVIECYANTSANGDKAPSSVARGFHTRGGTGVYYDNTFGTAFSAANITSNRSDETYASAGNWGLINGEIDGSQQWDGHHTPADGSGDGTHTGGTHATILTSAVDHGWTVNGLSNDAYGQAWYIRNITDGSGGYITANTSGTATVTLTGGTDNDWDDGDVYEITDGYPGLGQVGRGSKGEGGAVLDEMVLQPFFSWGNTLTLSLTSGDSARHVQENRDFFNVADIDAANAHASFDADPTTAGLQDYTPYPYPHPLQGIVATGTLTTTTLTVGP